MSHTPELLGLRPDVMPNGASEFAPVLVTSTEVASELIEAARAAKSGETPRRVSVRKLLAWFQAQRRGSFIVWYIRERLKEYGLTTNPDFNSVWIDSEVELVPFVEPEQAGQEGADAHRPTSVDITGPWCGRAGNDRRDGNPGRRTNRRSYVPDREAGCSE